MTVHTSINQLPNEIITTILNHLPERYRRQQLYQCSLVSKRFNTTVNQLPWQQLECDDAKTSKRLIASISATSPPPATPSELEPMTAHASIYQLPNEIITTILNHLPERYRRQQLYQCSLISKPFNTIANHLLWQRLAFDDIQTSKRFIASVSATLPQRLSELGDPVRELQLYGTHWTDDQLRRLLPHIPHLKSFNISLTKVNIDTIWHQLSIHCQHLTSVLLESDDVTQASLSALAQHLSHHLTQLVWSVYPDQSPEWLEPLVRLQCPLEHLYIIAQSPLNENEHSILQQFDHLTSLTVQNFDHEIQTSLLYCPSSTCWWPQLTKLDLYPCRAIDDVTLIGFMESHPQLQDIQLLDAPLLTDKSVDTMIRCLFDLKRLEMAFNNHISSDALRRLILGCRGLTELGIIDFRNIRKRDILGELNSSSKNGGDDGCLILDQQEMKNIRAKVCSQ